MVWKTKTQIGMTDGSRRFSRRRETKGWEMTKFWDGCSDCPSNQVIDLLDVFPLAKDLIKAIFTKDKATLRDTNKIKDSDKCFRKSVCLTNVFTGL